MKLWIDDKRPMPNDYDLWAKNSDDAILLLRFVRVTEVSFDHDLGGDDTSRTIILWLCEHPKHWPNVCRVHTANPVGEQWLTGMIERYGPGLTR